MKSCGKLIWRRAPKSAFLLATLTLIFSSDAKAQSEEDTVDYIDAKLKSADSSDTKLTYDGFKKLEDHIYLLTYHRDRTFDLPGGGASETDWFGVKFDMRSLETFTASRQKLFLSDQSGISDLSCDPKAAKCFSITTCTDDCKDREESANTGIFLNIQGLASEDQDRIRRAFIHLKELSPTSIAPDLFDK